MRVHPKKGQFILTGSVRFTSRKAIRESLTGRFVNLELLPFSIAESHEEPLPNGLISWIQQKSFSELPKIQMKWLKKKKDQFDEFLKTGGLPGICFFRDAHVRAPRFEIHLETLLERDICLIINTPLSYRQLKALATQLAAEQGQPLNYSKLARQVGVSPPSIKKLISAMEAIFLLRTVTLENRASSVIFFEDQGTASYLLADERQPQRDLTRGLFSCILPQFLYRPETIPILFQYRTRGGAKVDIAIRTRYGTLGVIPTDSESATSSSISSARSFNARYPSAKVLIAHKGTEIQPISETILSVPFQLLISDQWT